MGRDDQTTLTSRRWQVLLITIVLALPQHYVPVPSDGMPTGQSPREVEAPTPHHAVMFQDVMFCTLLQVTEASPQDVWEIVRAVETARSRFEVDPFLIAGIIVVESGGNSQAISPKGALGLMQVMPRTGEAIAKELNRPWLGRETLLDIGDSIMYGTWYYSTLKEQFRGDEKTALAAYNWGPGHIRKRIRNQEKLPSQYPNKVLATQERIEDVFRNAHQKLFWRGSSNYRSRAGCS